ncbi:hypothetical protein BKA66DRAFT_457464 [Pyrenochaeta sp. MPI-SDFR-AT-0127]|nr:hypothetical protein BKA66DRAFT_457464 [Pyrenochaeta sp. MPI-SDFR-AT-0127]
MLEPQTSALEIGLSRCKRSHSAPEARIVDLESSLSPSAPPASPDRDATTGQTRQISEPPLPEVDEVGNEDMKERPLKRNKLDKKVEAVGDTVVINEEVMPKSSPTKRHASSRSLPPRRSKRIANSKISAQAAAERDLAAFADDGLQHSASATEQSDHRSGKGILSKRARKTKHALKKIPTDVEMSEAELDDNHDPDSEYPDELSMSESDDEGGGESKGKNT